MKLDYDIIEKIGEGNRGEVYKVKLENGTIAALKFSKNYDIEKEWQILNFLKGNFAPFPYFRGKRYIVMEYIDGVPLKNLINTKEYYLSLKEALKGAFYLDSKGIFHKQLGRYHHILFNGKNVKFIDFERGVFSEKSRNFLQIVGYYLKRDEKINQKILDEIIDLYFKNSKEALNKILGMLDICIKKWYN